MIKRDKSGRFISGNKAWKQRKSHGHKKGEFKHKKATKEKIRQTNIKKGIHPPIIYGRIPWNKDMKGIHISIKTEFKKGNMPWNKNIKGKKSHTWKGGLSFIPYSPEFSKELKEKIRKRDNYICQKCKEKEIIFTIKNRNGKIVPLNLTIHHIDYNKLNNEEKNLISLCRKCNSKVNFERNKWIKYFKEKIK